jgi:hypothetical protein
MIGILSSVILFFSLQCLYCEKTFRDKTVLKEHMRKKQHRKINSKNHIYDKYYVINYLVSFVENLYLLILQLFSIAIGPEV